MPGRQPTCRRSTTQASCWWRVSRPSALQLDHFFSITLVGDAVIAVDPHLSTIVYQEDLNIPYLGLKLALGEIDAEELTAHARRLRPTRRALRYIDQLDWDDGPPG